MADPNDGRDIPDVDNDGKAMQEFDSGEMAQDGARPTSGKKSTSRGSSRANSRPASAKSGTGSRPTSAKRSSRQSQAPAEEPLSITGSRPTSAASARSSADKERPLSSARQRPPSGRKSATPSGSKTASPAASRDGSANLTRTSPALSVNELQTSGQPESPGSRPSSGRPISRSRGGSATPNRSTGSGHSRSRASQERKNSPTPEPVSTEQGTNEEQAVTANTPDDNQGHWANAAGEDDGGPADLPPMTTDLGPGGGDGGDEFDDDDDEEEEMGDEEEGESEESDGESEMVVLDPDHPLMRRFQKTLKDHLLKQQEKVTLAERELFEALKNKKGDREGLGVELYGVQQELARHQMMLENHHDAFAKLAQESSALQTNLGDVRAQYRDKQFNVTDERKKGAELQAEVENLALRLFYMENAKEDVRSDIAVMKRAAEKAESEVSKSEGQKQKQDLYVDRLVERVDKLREEISMFEAQLSAQLEETKAAKEALSEAHMEIEQINLEKKQLFQQWNSSLIGMRRRDEAHSAMLEALHQQQQRILSLETEIEGYKRSISKEQEQNEKLTLILNKTQQDIATVKKMLQQCLAKHDALKNEYATYSRMLHETEQALNRASTDKVLRQNELNALRKQIEREYLEKVKLEDEILEKLRTQLTLDKASQYTDKLTGNLRQRSKDLDSQTAQVENDISKDTLEVANVISRIERLQKVMDDLDEEIRAKNEIISRSEQEIVKRNAIIERKQGVIDQYNKKLELMISQAGGVELGPLEIKIHSLQKSIETELQEIQELQQRWLRDQSELVRLSKEKDAQGSNVMNMKRQLTILTQKKIRMEGEIDTQRQDTAQYERSINNMQNEMLKLNMLLHRERGLEHNLQQNNVLMESEFIGNLKQAEKESVEMQDKLTELKEEKERLLNSLVEAERQIMLWEKKTQLARETKAAVDSEIGQGEIRAMKAEIHRMQVRYQQLMKQQERMIQEMEKAVSRRDTIVTRGDAQAKMNKKTLTKGTFQRQMGELKKKIKTTIQDAASCDGEIREYREHQQELGGQLEDKQLNVQQLQSNADTLDGDIDRLYEQKQKNMSDLIARQQKAKYYAQVKEGKYNRLCKTESTLGSEQSKQVDRMQTISAIADRLIQEYPHVQPSMKKVGLTYGSRALATDSL